MAEPTKTLDDQSRAAGDHGLSLRALAPTVTPATTSTAATPRYFDSRLSPLPGVHLPLTSMMVEAGAGSLLISPVATPEEAAAIGARATTTLLAPSLLHHLTLPDAIARYHPVEVWGPPGLHAKRPQLGPVRVFGVDPWPHGDTLDFVLLEGAPRRNEMIFFHRASRTIYTADVFFNLHHPDNLPTSIAYRLLGVKGRFVVPITWKAFVTDKAKFQRSLERVLEWDFDHIAMAHGELISRGGKALAVAALQNRGYL